MKKMTAILLALLMLMLAGCNKVGGGDETTVDTNDTEETSAEDVTTVDETTDCETTVPETTALETTTADSTEETTAELVPDTGYPIDRMTIGNAAVTAYSLVCNPEAMDGEKTAVSELIQYMAQATGYTIPVLGEGESAEFEIVVGSTDRDTEAVVSARSTLVNDGYALMYENNRLYITGKTARGTVYGIYEFMEKFLGVRFYEADFVVVRDNPVVEIPADLNIVYSPTLQFRHTSWNCVHAGEQSLHHRFNIGLRRDLDGGFAYAGGFVHTLADLAEIPYETGVQPCLTDEAVYQTVLKNVRAWLDENPNRKIVSVSQTDSYDYQLGCQCENCLAIDEREGTPMGSLLTFVNRIADDIKDDYPGVYVDTLAYRYTRKAPRTIVPRDNVIIRLCSIECCFVHPIGGDTCENNVAFQQDIIEWSEICEHLFIWDYTTNYAYPSSPFPNLLVLRQNAQFFADHNVIGLYEEGYNGDDLGEFAELRAYLLGKVAWNPYMTEEEYNTLMNEFLQDYYGPGWESVRAYIDRLAEVVAKRSHLDIFDNPLNILPMEKEDGTRDTTLYKELRGYWETALAATETVAQREHVEQSMMQILVFGQLHPRMPGVLPTDAALIEEYRQKYNVDIRTS